MRTYKLGGRSEVVQELLGCPLGRPEPKAVLDIVPEDAGKAKIEHLCLTFLDEVFCKQRLEQWPFAQIVTSWGLSLSIHSWFASQARNTP